MATAPMTFTEHPRLLARIAGVFYLIITACALFAYLYVRGQVIVPGDMARTAANILAHEQLYRTGFSAAVIVVICNPPLGLILYELLKVVNPRLALPIPYIQWVTLIAELSLALWLLVVGVNEAKWRARAQAVQGGSSVR